MSDPEPKGEIILYQSPDGSSRIECRFAGETLWLSLNQMADLFGRDKSFISKHLKSIFEDGELDRISAVANYATTAADGKTYQVDTLNRLVVIFLEQAELRAKQRQDLTLDYWQRIDSDEGVPLAVANRVFGMDALKPIIACLPKLEARRREELNEMLVA